MLKPSTPSISYRPDIDGLRAIAVLVVIAFHIGIYRLHGGFIGVDVFFVISGFLICSLIYGDLEGGRFSLARFYERRIRRILPALLVVLATTTIAAAFVLLPARLEDYARSLAAAALSFSNVHFWQTAGYFDAPAEVRPLLHTWSLAVEEQFYLVFPLLMALLHRFGRRVVIATLATLGAVSLAVSVFGVYWGDRSAAFYLPFGRAWELMLGALIALDAAPRLRGLWAHGASIAGLALIAGSALWMSSTSPFPGLGALPACLGAALVIAAGRGGEGVVARVLAWRPVVFIGLISYSLYLWHWPIIVLVKEATLEPRLSHLQQAEVLAACVALSLFSWALVERPMRRAPAPRGLVFGAAGAGTLAVVAAAFTVMAGRGWPERLPGHAAQTASYVGYTDPANFRTGVCFIDSRHDTAIFRASVCLRQAPNEQTVVLMGDSHAAHLWRALANEMPHANVLQATASGCRPTVAQADWAAARCVRVMNYMFEHYLPTHNVDLLLLSAAWTRGDEERLAETLTWAQRHGINAVVLGPSTAYDVPLPALLAREELTGDHSLAERHQDDSVILADRALAQAAAPFPGRYVSTYQIICPQGRCRRYVADHVPLQYDGDHFTPEGARFIVRQLEYAGVLRTASPHIAHVPDETRG